MLLVASAAAILLEKIGLLPDQKQGFMCAIRVKKQLFFDDVTFKSGDPRSARFLDGVPLEQVEADIQREAKLIDGDPAKAETCILCSKRKIDCLNIREMVYLLARFERGRRQLEAVHDQLQDVFLTIAQIGLKRIFKVIKDKVEPGKVRGTEQRAEVLFGRRIVLSKMVEKAVLKTISYYAGFPCTAYESEAVYFPPEFRLQSLTDAVIDLNVSNLYDLFSILALLVEFRVYSHELYQLLKDIDPKVAKWDPELSLDEIIPIQQQIRKQIKVCKVKLQSALLKNSLGGCLDFVHPDNYLHISTFWGDDYQRAALLSHQLKSVFLNGNHNEPAPAVKGKYSRIDFFSSDPAMPQLTRVNLVADEWAGISMKSNSLKKKFTKMDFEK